MTQSSHELDVVTAFRSRLTELPEPQRQTRGVRAFGAMATLAALAVVVVFAGSDAPPHALAITRGDASLELRIADASADSGQMTRELNGAGIRGRILVVPVSPQQAGTWVIVAEVAGRTITCIPPPGTPHAAETVRLPDIENASTVLRIPLARVRESTGSFVLVAGRDARQGERTVDTSSPAAVHRDVLEPVLGPPAAKLRAC